PAIEVLAAEAASGAFVVRCRALGCEQWRHGSRGSERLGCGSFGPDPGAGPRGRLLPDRGHRRGQRQRPAQRLAGQRDDREDCRLMLPLADTTVVEATWVMIVKSLVFFAVFFGILPLMTVLERKLIGRFQHRYGPNRVGPFG